MTADPQTVTVTVTGPPEQLAAFAELCLTVEYLCSVGSSRTVEVPVDGDGSGALRFDFGDTDVSDITPAEVGSADAVRVSGIGG